MTGFYCGARIESGPTEAERDVPMTGFEGFGRVSMLHSRHLSDNDHRRSDFGPIHYSLFLLHHAKDMMSWVSGRLNVTWVENEPTKLPILEEIDIPLA
jgi:hypothetical protein